MTISEEENDGGNKSFSYLDAHEAISWPLWVFSKQSKSRKYSLTISNRHHHLHENRMHLGICLFTEVCLGARVKRIPSSLTGGADHL